MSKVVAPMELQEMAAGIIKVRLPLPFRLDHVNCYLLRGENGWTIVDTGINTSLARQGWQLALAEAGIAAQDIEQLVVTHVHPDHFGLAGWLQTWLAEQGRPGRLPVLISGPEKAILDTLWRQPERHLQNMVDYFRRGGMPEALAVSVAEETGKTGRRTLPHPTDVTVVEAGSRLDLGRRQWQVMVGSGHSPGVILLYDEERRILLCSDHMLIKITPHIGFWPNMADEPLTEYLASLRRLQTLPVAIAYPGHRDPIPDWAGRLGELLDHHEARLEATYEAVPAGEPKTVTQIATTVFRLADLNAHEMRFAIAETWSHIVWLVKARRLHEIVRAGVAYYERDAA